MLVKIPEDDTGVKSDGFYCSPGEMRDIPDDIARAWIARGWAEDPTGVIPTGEKQIIRAGLNVQNVVHKQKPKNPGG